MFADVMLPFFGVNVFRSVYFFRFYIFAFIRSVALRSIVLRYIFAPTALRS